MLAKKSVAILFVFALLMTSFVAAGSFYDLLELITGMVPGNDPNNQGDAPGGNATPPGLVGVPSPPRCGDGVCSTAEAHTDDASAVYCPEDCDYVVVQDPEPEPNTGVVGGPSCSDSDNGDDHKTKGQVTANGANYADTCYSPYKIEEFTCNDFAMSSHVHPCLIGPCVDGKCVEAPAPPTTYTYVPAAGVVQKLRFSSLSAPAYLNLVRDEPRTVGGNVQITYSVVSGKNIVTLFRGFEIPSDGFLEIDGVKYSVSAKGNSLVLERLQGRKVSARVTDGSSIISSKTGSTSQLRTTAQPLLGRETFFKRLAASFSRA